MGTHPIFESDFDCLTEHWIMSKREVERLKDTVGYCDQLGRANGETSNDRSSPELLKRRNRLVKSAKADKSESPRRKRTRPKSSKEKLSGWFVMFSNEENARRAKGSYTRYNYSMRADFGTQNNNGQPFGFVDTQLTERLTEELCVEGREVHYWFPYPASSSSHDGGHGYKRAKLIRLSEWKETKSDSEQMIESLRAVFDTESISGQVERASVRKMLTKLLGDMVKKAANGGKPDEIKVHETVHQRIPSDRLKMIQDRGNMMKNILQRQQSTQAIAKRTFSKFGIDDILNK